MKRWWGGLVSLALAAGLGAGNASAQQGWNTVTLRWTTPGDDSLSGTAAQFDIRYSTTPITAANFASATPWTTGVPLPAAPGTLQSVVVGGLLPLTTYFLAIRTADEVPNWSGLSNVASKRTLAVPDTVRPAPLALATGAVTDTSATLAWPAVGDDSLAGTATTMELRSSPSPITIANWAQAALVPGVPSPAAAGTAQQVVVGALARQSTTFFAARAFDEAGNGSALSNVPRVTTPDSKPPLAIVDLAVNLVWLNFGRLAVLPRRPGIASQP